MAVALVWAVSAAAAGIVLVSADGSPDGPPEDHHEEAVVTLSEPVPLGTGTGTGRLEIEAARGEAGSVLAGGPVTFRFHLDGVDEVASVDLDVRHRTGDGSAARRIDVERTGTVVVNTGGGEIHLLSGSADGHQHGGASPGAGLASMSGSAAEWAIRLGPGSERVVVDDRGRWVVSAHVDHPVVDVVDVLLRTMRSVELPAPARNLMFTPDGTSLWALGPDGTLSVIDLGAATVERTIGVPSDSATTAADAVGAVALVSEEPGADAQLVRVADGSVLASVPRGGLRDVQWAAAVNAFVGLDGSGALVAIDPDGTRRTVRSPDVPAPGSFLAVMADGTRGIVVDPDTTTATVVDLAIGSVLGVAATGPNPAQVSMLEQFAIIRDGTDPVLTWIDLEQPDRSADLPLGTTDAPASLSGQAGTGEVLAPLPGDETVLRVHVMMGRPMVMGSDPTGLPADTAALTTSQLVQSQDDTWEITTVLPEAGSYQLALRTPVGRAEFAVEAGGEGPAVALVGDPVRLAAEVDQSVDLTFTLSGLSADEVGIVVYEGASASQQHLIARRVESANDSSTYRARVIPGVVGDHQVFTEPTGTAPIPATLVATVTATAVD